MDRNNKNNNSEITVQEKGNIIAIVAIVVSLIAVLSAALIGVFNKEIHNLFIKEEESTSAAYEDSNVVPDADLDNHADVTDKSPVNKNTEKPSVAPMFFNNNNSNSNDNIISLDSDTNTVSMDDGAIDNPSPDISLGEQISYIEFLGIESNSIFFNSKAPITSEIFYNGIEKEFKADSNDDYDYYLFTEEGIGVYCSIPLKEKGVLWFNSGLCDKNKIQTESDEIDSSYGFHTSIMHRNEDKNLILCFTLEKPLKPGIYYAKFYIVDHDKNKDDDVYIKFRVG